MQKRAISVHELLRKRRKVVQFDSPWSESIGHPELRGTWFVWAKSGSGKTTYVCQFAKYMTKFGRVLYNSLEEGDSESMRLAWQNVNMHQVKGKIALLDREPIAALRERLSKPKSPNIVIIDSIQYARLNFREYLQLEEDYYYKLFIVISQAKGKEPKGKVADDIMYHANVKTYIEGFRAFFKSRYGGGQTYDVWPEGAEKYYAANTVDNEKVIEK